VETDKILGFDLRTKKKRVKGGAYKKGKRTEDKVVEELNRIENSGGKGDRKEKSESDSEGVRGVVWNIIKKGVRWLGIS